MKRSAKRLGSALLIVSIYIFALPDPTGRELTLSARWATTPELASVVPSAASPLVPINLGPVFVYLDESGQVTYRGRPAFRVAMSAEGFINYSQGAEQLVFQDSRGGFGASLPVSGYPMFVADRLFVVSDGGGVISEWTVDGAEVWRMHLPAPLLSLAASEEHVVLGLAAGGPHVLARDGSPLALQRASTNAEPLVYAVELSSSPERIAVIAGVPTGQGGSADDLDSVEATLTLYDVESSTGVPVVRRRILRDTQSDPLVRLVDNGAVLRYSDVRDDHVLVSLDIESGDESVVPMSYPPTDAIDLGIPGMQAVLSVSNRRDPSRGFATPVELVFSTSDGTVPVRASWAADSVSIARLGPSSIVRVDERVLAFTVEAR